jgi:hypothetical protein
MRVDFNPRLFISAIICGNPRPNFICALRLPR